MSKGINKDIELRSEKVRNIIGKIPPRLLRIGIAIISLIILITLVIAYFVPYPQYKTYPMQIYSYPLTQIVRAPELGTGVRIDNMDSVFKGKPICMLKTLQDSTFFFNAKISGQLYCNFTNGDYIEKDDILFSIIPDSIDFIYGICYVPYNEIHNIKSGQEMTISSTDLLLTGQVAEIYPIVEVDKTTKELLTKMKIKFPKHILSNRDILFLLQNLERKGTVLVSEKSILRGILNLN